MSALLCPTCYLAEVRIVGAYVYTPTGISNLDDHTVTVSDLNKPDAFLTQFVYYCEHCHKHHQQADMINGNIEKTAVSWHMNFDGKNIPLVCPVCKNNHKFVEDALVLVFNTRVVDFQDSESKPLAVNPYPEDEDIRQRIPLVYRCGVEGCSGTVVINEDTFKVTRQ